eukprot:GHVS01065817.1.p1 GENE.GHVS01065817.1~~GHVS01065817.1.p1  ORF type:complete len:494 (-),score=59.95 GHVS01065817.1:73-1554(-)
MAVISRGFLEFPTCRFRWLSNLCEAIPVPLHRSYSPSSRSNVQEALRELPPHIRLIPLGEFSSPYGGGACSECLVVVPVLHGSSPQVPCSGPGTEMEATSVVETLRPKRLFLQLGAERLQRIGGHIWSVRKKGCADCCGLRWLGQKDFWNRWSVYPRIHGGPLSFELQRPLAAAMELRGGDGSQCDVIPIDLPVSVSVRRFHEKCLYGAGDSEYKGYMQYAKDSIRFWYESSHISNLPALQSRFRRLAPLAYATLIEEKTKFMAGQILRGTDGGSPSHAKGGELRWLEKDEGAALNNLSVVVCGAMEAEALERQLLKLLRQREEVIRSSSFPFLISTNSKKANTTGNETLSEAEPNTTIQTATTSERPRLVSSLWPSQEVCHGERGVGQWGEDVMRVLPAELEAAYFREPCGAPPVTQVPLLIFRYFLLPIGLVLVGVWVAWRLLRCISGGTVLVNPGKGEQRNQREKNGAVERTEDVQKSNATTPNPCRAIL